MPCETFQSVVRMIGLGVQNDNIFGDLGFSITIFVPHSQDAVAFRQIHPTVRSKFQIHGGVGRVVEHLSQFSPPGVIEIAKDEDLIMFRPDIIVRPEICVSGHDPNATL